MKKFLFERMDAVLPLVLLLLFLAIAAVDVWATLAVSQPGLSGWLRSSYWIIAFLALVATIGMTGFFSYYLNPNTRIVGWPIPSVVFERDTPTSAWWDFVGPLTLLAFPMNFILYMFIPSVVFLLLSYIYLGGGSLSFSVGLGITQVVDGLMSALAKDLNRSFIPRLISFVLDVVIAGILVGAGALGRRRYRWAWAILAGMGLYALDALIFIWVSDWLAIAFHAFALWGLWKGLQAINAIRLLEKDGPILIPAAAAIEQPPMPRTSPRTFRIFVLVVVGVPSCMLLFMLVLLFLPELLK